MYEGLYDTREGLTGDDAALIGLMTVKLLLPWDRWIHRRVDHVTFSDVDAVRRSISIDFTLPRWFHQARGTPNDIAISQLVPLGFLRKSALVNFSLGDEAGASLPLLTYGQNAQVAEAVLIRIARHVLGKDVPDLIRGDIHSLVREPVDRAEVHYFNLFNAHDPVRETRRALRRSLTFFSLATSLRDNFLALSMVKIGRNQRRVLHLSYEKLLWDRRGLRHQISRMWQQASGHPRTLYITIPAVSECESHHLEIEAPDGLMITRRESYSILESDEEVRRQTAPGGYRRAHFHCANAAPRSMAVAIVHLRPRSSNLVRAASLMGILVFLAILGITIQYGEIRGGEHAAAAGLLLAGAGIIGLVVVRSGESELATALLFPLRVLATVPVVLAVLATVVVVIDMQKLVGYVILTLFTIGVFFSTGLLLRNWYMIRRASRRYAQKMMRPEGEASFE